MIFLSGTFALAQDKPVVLVSVIPQEYFVKRIAGDAITTQVMVTSGDDHGGYEPTVKQMKAASQAVAYITVGHPHFVFEEKWLSRIREVNPTLAIAPGFAGMQLIADDPHPWVSPKAALVLIDNIERTLSTAFPRNSELFHRNSQAVRQEVADFDAELTARMATIKQRSFLVFHPTWGYFAADYNLSQLAIEHEGKEANVGSLQETIAEARKRGITRVVVQPQFSRQSAEAVASELGATVIEVDPFAPDWFAATRAFAEAVSKP